MNLLLVLLFVILPLAARAQDAPTTPAATPEQIAARIKALHPKTLVLVFDISASTQTGGVFRQERAAAATLIRQGCSPGDRVALYAFDTGFKVLFDKTLTNGGDAGALVDQLPTGVSSGRGTNIRRPHHEALKLIERNLPHPGCVILLTDSFNDRPLTSDPNYGDYLKYYSLRSLTKYPDTRENRDYERLLRTLKAGGRLCEDGVGIAIAPNGRPIERLPVNPGEGDQGQGDATLAPTVLTPIGQEKTGSNLPAILAGIGLLLLALLAGLFALMNRPVSVRLREGERGTPRDYRLRKGAKIGLGGALTTAAPGDDVFPLGGIGAPPAYVQADRGGAQLIPAPHASPPDTVVFHNGVRLEAPAALRVGDEIRIALPATDLAPPREHRIRFEDPRAATF